VAKAVDELKQVPLFSSLSQRQLRRLAHDCRERTFKPGTSMLQQGHMSGIEFFMIAEGKASVRVNGRKVATLGPGAHFGELALIGGRPRTATVTAETPLRCLVMKSWDFRRFVMENPQVSWKLLQHMAALLDKR
jgi:CRP-like cAMP-binding protein